MNNLQFRSTTPAAAAVARETHTSNRAASTRRVAPAEHDRLVDTLVSANDRRAAALVYAHLLDVKMDLPADLPVEKENAMLVLGIDTSVFKSPMFDSNYRAELDELKTLIEIREKCDELKMLIEEMIIEITRDKSVALQRAASVDVSIDDILRKVFDTQIQLESSRIDPTIFNINIYVFQDVMHMGEDKGHPIQEVCEQLNADIPRLKGILKDAKEALESLTT